VQNRGSDLYVVAIKKGNIGYVPRKHVTCFWSLEDNCAAQLQMHIAVILLICLEEDKVLHIFLVKQL